MISKDRLKVGVFAAMSCLAACEVLPADDDDPTIVPPPPGGPSPGGPSTDEPPTDEPADDPTDPHIIDIDNVWQVRGEPGHSFSFFATPRARTSVPIFGQEHLAGDAGSRTVDGWIDNGRIHFTATMGTSVLTFDGIINDDKTMHLRVDADPPHIVLSAGPGALLP